MVPPFLHALRPAVPRSSYARTSANNSNNRCATYSYNNTSRSARVVLRKGRSLAPPATIGRRWLAGGKRVDTEKRKTARRFIDTKQRKSPFD